MSMSNCLKCSYPKGEPKGARVCRKCQRPENVPKEAYVFTQSEPVGGPGVTSSALSPPLPVLLPLETTGGSSLPEHSKMGGSAAHRFLNCPGSTALIDLIKHLAPDSLEGD